MVAGEKRLAFGPFSPSFPYLSLKWLKCGKWHVVVSPQTHQLLVCMETTALTTLPVFLHKYCLFSERLCLNTLLFEDTSGEKTVSSVLFSCKPA